MEVFVVVVALGGAGGMGAGGVCVCVFADETVWPTAGVKYL